MSDTAVIDRLRAQVERSHAREADTRAELDAVIADRDRLREAWRNGRKVNQSTAYRIIATALTEGRLTADAAAIFFHDARIKELLALCFEVYEMTQEEKKP